jgi:ribonucleoside-diphosphate reductase alpha chain
LTSFLTDSKVKSTFTERIDMGKKLRANTEKILRDRYYLRDSQRNLLETEFQQPCRRIADYVALAHLQKFGDPRKLKLDAVEFTAENEKEGKKALAEAKQFSNRIFEIHYNQEFAANSPTWFNAGNPYCRKMLSACFILHVPNSIEGIYKAVQDGAIIGKYGGGIGMDASQISPYGTPTNSGGIASGALSFMSPFQDMAGTVVQGGRRRIAEMMMLAAWHPEILLFIDCKRKTGPERLQWLIDEFAVDLGTAKEIAEGFNWLHIKNKGTDQEQEEWITPFCYMNISVKISREFMEAVHKDSLFMLRRAVVEDEDKGPRAKKVRYEPWTGPVIDPRGENGEMIIEKDGVKYIRARKLWYERLMPAAHASAEPGIFFEDAVNEDNPVKSLGPIHNSNPCVVGNSLITTREGFSEVNELIYRFLEQDDPELVVNNQGTPLRTRISEVHLRGTRKVVKVSTSVGLEFKVTPDHKMISAHRGKVPVNELVLNEELVLTPDLYSVVDQHRPLGWSNKRLRYERHNSQPLPEEWIPEIGTVVGWLLGDGCANDSNNITQWIISKFELDVIDTLRPAFEKVVGTVWNPTATEFNTHIQRSGRGAFIRFLQHLGMQFSKAEDKRLPRRFFTAPKSIQQSLIQALFTADGTVADSDNGSRYVRLTSKSRGLLQDVQLLLLLSGVRSRIYDRSREPREKAFSYKKKSGEVVHYASDGVCWELSISGVDLVRFKDRISFFSIKKKIALEAIAWDRSPKDDFRVYFTGLEPAGEEPVYDLTVPPTHTFGLSALESANCGEYAQVDYNSCNLGSINLLKVFKRNPKYPISDWARHIDWKALGAISRTGVRFLDYVISMNEYPIPEITKTTNASRPVGLGDMGWADLLLMLEVAYGSDLSYQIAESIQEWINYHGWVESTQLAEEFGEFPELKNNREFFDKKMERLTESIKLHPAYSGHLSGEMLLSYRYKKFGVRHCHVTVIAPTGTIANIDECSYSIEPHTFFVYKRQDTVGVRYYYSDIAYAKLMELHSSDLPANLKPLADSQANEDQYQAAKWLFDNYGDKLPEYFVDASRVTPEQHVRMQAAFQKFCDNAISKTCNMPESSTVEDVAKVYDLAYQLNLKGCTVYREGSRHGVIVRDKKPEVKKLDGQVLPPEPKPVIRDGQLEVIPRPAFLDGGTYVVPDGHEGKLYVTANYQDDNGRIIEVFLKENSGNEWTELAGRLISLLLRSNVPVKEIRQQLRRVGGQSAIWYNGKYFSSSVQLLDEVLFEQAAKYFASKAQGKVFKQELSDPGPEELEPLARGPRCPDCGAKLVAVGGCFNCADPECGYSKCK